MTETDFKKIKLNSENDTKQNLNIFDSMHFLLFLATLGSGICVGPGVDLGVGSGTVGVGVGSSV